MLFVAIEANKNTRRFIIVEDEDRNPLDYRGALDEAALSEYVRDHDYRSADEPRTWAKRINRWINGQAVPTPENVRRILAALDANWVVGLGEAGFKQHALCVIHEMWKTGAIKVARAHAAAIFCEEAFKAQALFSRNLNAFAAGTVFTQRLDECASRAWPQSQDGDIPTRPVPPRDMRGSRLYEAWLLIDAVLRSEDVELDFRDIQSNISRVIDDWLSETDKTSRLRPASSAARPLNFEAKVLA